MILINNSGIVLYHLMSYSDLLWDSTNIVIKQSQFHRTLFEDFLLIVNNRIQIQQNYSSELKSVALYLDKHLNKQYKDKDSLIFILSALKSDLVRRENQGMLFVENLKEDVYKITKQFLENQIVQQKKLEKYIQTIETGYAESKKKMEAAKSKLQLLDSQRQEQFIKLQIAKARGSSSSQQIQKQTGRTRYVQKQYKQYDSTYRVIMKTHNSYVQGYLDSLEYYLKTYQRHQQQRISKMMDGMNKILVFQSGMMKNFQYDVTNISNQLSTVQISKDIKQFALKYCKKNPKPKLQTLPKLNLRNTVVYEMLIRKQQDKQEYEADCFSKLNLEKIKQKQRTEDNEQNQYIFGIYKQILSMKDIFNKTDNYQDTFTNSKLKQLLDNQQNRNFMQIYLRKQCQQNNYETNPFLIMLAKQLIQKCFAKKDIFCLRRLLTLAFTQFSLKSGKTQQNLLYYSIFDLSIWQLDDFWEAALFESIQQTLKQIKLNKNESKQDIKTRQKIIILNQLADYCNMMVMLAFKLKNIKQIAGKFLRMYSLGEQESTHLLGIINRSLTISKEVRLNYEKNTISQQNK